MFHQTFYPQNNALVQAMAATAHMGGRKSAEEDKKTDGLKQRVALWARKKAEEAASKANDAKERWA